MVVATLYTSAEEFLADLQEIEDKLETEFGLTVSDCLNTTDLNIGGKDIILKTITQIFGFETPDEENDGTVS